MNIWGLRPSGDLDFDVFVRLRRLVTRGLNHTGRKVDTKDMGGPPGLQRPCIDTITTRKIEDAQSANVADQLSCSRMLGSNKWEVLNAFELRRY